jgi:hypothetical protein
MHYLSLIYFVKQPLHVSGMFIAHHQEVFTVYVQQLVRVIRLGDWQLVGSGWNWFHPLADTETDAYSLYDLEYSYNVYLLYFQVFQYSCLPIPKLGTNTQARGGVCVCV